MRGCAMELSRTTRIFKFCAGLSLRLTTTTFFDLFDLRIAVSGSGVFQNDFVRDRFACLLNQRTLLEPLIQFPLSPWI